VEPTPREIARILGVIRAEASNALSLLADGSAAREPLERIAKLARWKDGSMRGTPQEARDTVDRAEALSAFHRESFVVVRDDKRQRILVMSKAKFSADPPFGTESGTILHETDAPKRDVPIVDTKR
jgi:hypothetical protein